MDSGDFKSNERPTNQPGVEVLDDRIHERFELYQTMSTIFFNWIPDEDKVKAMAEVIDIMKGENNEG